MALYKGLLKKGFSLPACEKHFHDHDESWLILTGKGTGYWIDPDGKREEFPFEAGDVWVVPVGYEHGLVEGSASQDLTISVTHGVMPPGSHAPGHYHMEKEGYVPSFQLVKTLTARYAKPSVLPPKMRGVMFVEKGKAVLQEEPTPSCKPGHILCETIYSGITNGTERNVLIGGNYGGMWPNRCGYQTVGRVVEVGAAVNGYAVGDIVFSGNFHQHVAYFAADVSNPDAAHNLILRLPATIDPKHAALFGMASVAMHDVRRAETRLGDNALVVGAGSIGLFTMQGARAAGARVAICDPDERRLDVAARLGANKTFAIKDDESWNAVRAWGPYDVIFEDSGAPVLDKLVTGGWGPGMLKRRGKLVLIAGRREVTYSFNAGQGCELTILHAGHFERSDLLELSRLVAEGVIQVGPIIRDVVPIDRAPEIYDRLRDDPNSLLGTVFVWKS